MRVCIMAVKEAEWNGYGKQRSIVPTTGKPDYKMNHFRGLTVSEEIGCDQFSLSPTNVNDCASYPCGILSQHSHGYKKGVL